MQMVSKHIVSEEIVVTKTVITTKERRFLLWTKERKFEAQREYPTGYWEWLELPNRRLVCDATSFQLDAWNRLKTGG